MSTNITKRGTGPAKVTSTPVDIQLPSVQKKSTKQSTKQSKSTKTAPKSTQATSTQTPPKSTQTSNNASAKAPPPKKSAPVPIGKSATPKSNQQVAAQPLRPTKPTPVQPAASKPEQPQSKILNQVRELETKKATAPPASTSKPSGVASKTMPSTAKPTSTPPQSTVTASTKQTVQTTLPSSKTHSSIKPSSPPTPPSPPPPPPAPNAPKPHVPIAALNSEIVSNIATRAGARPNTSGSHDLPKGYKTAARKVTMTIVALPIALVTSYVLYQRLVLGEEPKALTPAPRVSEEPAKVDASKS